MSRPCTVTVNGETFMARPGDRILDAALIGGVDMPHECRSGQCGTCLVRVLDGHALGGESRVPGMVHACQAHVIGDLRLAVEEVPAVTRLEAAVVAITPLVPGVVEVVLATGRAYPGLAGQYAHVTFAGFPARAFSPTVALDGADRPGTIRLHVKQRPGGRVSGAIGHTIGLGHRAIIEGPFGSAWLRPGEASRLVLFAGGTGFAPIWAIADAALRENVGRRIVVVAGVRRFHTLYMAPALERMAQCPNVAIIAVAVEAQGISPYVRAGRPTDFASIIAAGDTVHAAGPPDMVATLAGQAATAGAAFHADPFLPREEDEARWLARAARAFRQGTGQWRKPLAAAPLAVVPGNGNAGRPLPQQTGIGQRGR